MTPLRLTLLVAAAAATAACGASSDAAASASDVRTDSAGGLVVAPTTPYHATESEAATALVVTVAAGSTANPTPPSGCANGSTSAAETVFWVDGIREGKPLPNERRYQLVNGECGMEPRMQATVIGGAVNVFNDAGTHRIVFVRAGTTDTLQIMPFTMPGSMVATDRLTRIAGVIEAKCAQHPNEKAYIAVFDHPYFGVASSGDKVTLDAIPAGDYKVMTWHEGMTAPAAVPAKVSPTGQTEIVLR